MANLLRGNRICNTSTHTLHTLHTQRTRTKHLLLLLLMYIVSCPPLLSLLTLLLLLFSRLLCCVHVSRLSSSSGVLFLLLAHSHICMSISSRSYHLCPLCHCPLSTVLCPLSLTHYQSYHIVVITIVCCCCCCQLH